MKTDEQSVVPVELLSTPHCKLFYKKDNKFSVPKGLLNCYCYTVGILKCHIYPKYWDRQARENSVDPDQTPHNAASDLGLHCLPLIQHF